MSFRQFKMPGIEEVGKGYRGDRGLKAYNRLASPERHRYDEDWKYA